MSDPLSESLAIPDKSVEIALKTEADDVMNTGNDSFVSTATTTVEGMDNGSSVNVNGGLKDVLNTAPAPVSKTIHKSDVNDKTDKHGLKQTATTSPKEPRDFEDSDNQESRWMGKLLPSHPHSLLKDPRVRVREQMEQQREMERMQEMEAMEQMQRMREIERMPPSRRVQAELSELRRQLADLTRQAQEDRNERQMRERILHEEQLYPIPILGREPIRSMARSPPRRRDRNRDRDRDLRIKAAAFGRRYHMHGGNSDDDYDDSDDDEQYGKAAEHKQRMEKMFQRELKFLRRDQVIMRRFQNRVDEFRSQEQSWSWEKRKLENSIREEKEKAQSRSPAGQDVTNASTVEKQPESQAANALPPPPKHAISLLSRVSWDMFKVIQRKAEHECHAIEILVGEPDIRLTSMTHWLLEEGPHRLKKGRKLPERKPPTSAAVASKKTVDGTQVPGQAPVAERIRINSTHIIKILEKIHGTALASSDGVPVVMIRPFRALVYYSDQIQQRFQELESEFAIKPERPDTVNVIASGAADPSGDATNPGDEEMAKINETLVNGKPSTDEQKEMKEKIDEYTGSALAYQQMQVLMDFLDTEIKTKLAYLASDQCQKVAFTDVWYLFKPGDEVIDRSRRQVFRVIRVTSPPHQASPQYHASAPWLASPEQEDARVTVTCVYIDFDGKQLGPVRRDFEFKRFDGEKLVTTLDVYPLRFIQEDVRGKSSKRQRKTLRERLIERGRRFMKVAKVKHMHYNGHTIDERDEVDSQVVIDFGEALSKIENNWQVDFSSIIESKQEEKPKEKICAEECCRNDHIHEDSYAENRRNNEYIAGLIPQDKFTEPSVSIFPRNLTDFKTPEKTILDEDLLIMSYRVFGYVLRSRKWAKLDLQFLLEVGAKRLDGDDEDEEDDEDEDGKGGKLFDQQSKAVRPDGTREHAEEDETAFDQLVLPGGHKKMVKSLVAQHFRDKEAATAQTEQADVVRGKGKGLIILLHGAPGVGKTTTAEGIAELFKKPLFQITCGDLGTTASEVEKALETHFALASRWGCILLLDEADVFLAARTSQDFIRNGLVAVFLRVLEYYSGILFLTTNRIGTFDEAFASRIHISLHYPQLDLESTLAVFRLNFKLIRKRFAKKKREIDIKEQEILDYAQDYWEKNDKTRWNGRQIRNACQTALALAEFDAQGGDHTKIVDKHAKVEFTLGQLKVVGKAYLEFIQYLDDVYDRDAETRAKYLRIRAREGKKKKGVDARLLARKGLRKGKDEEKGWESVDDIVEDRNQATSPLPPQHRQQGAPPEVSQGPAFGMPPGGYMAAPVYYPAYGQPPPTGGPGQAPRIEGQNTPYQAASWGPPPPNWAYAATPAAGYPMPGGPVPSQRRGDGL
ncbi:hypothetical protein ABW21_db0205046 [Orbilia brochopaga]|nr:hypothetical protein ABW21_db0205046 [Drechslerella brochopaga]